MLFEFSIIIIAVLPYSVGADCQVLLGQQDIPQGQVCLPQE